MEAFSSKLNVSDVRFIPISALHGDNVVDRSKNMDWYEGSTLLYTLENIHISGDENTIDCRFPVQHVIRPQSDEFHDFRGYAGRIAGGVFKPGDEVMTLPSGFTTKIKEIHGPKGTLEEAFAPMSITMTLEDEIDISRGGMIVKPQNQPQSTQDFEAMVCWMNDRPAQVRGKYVIQHTSSEARCMLTNIEYKVDINTLHRVEDDKTIGSNDIGRVSFRTTQPLFLDAYTKNRRTGSFILVDEGTNETVAAGMILSK